MKIFSTQKNDSPFKDIFTDSDEMLSIFDIIEQQKYQTEALDTSNFTGKSKKEQLVYEVENRNPYLNEDEKK